MHMRIELNIYLIQSRREWAEHNSSHSFAFCVHRKLTLLHYPDWIKLTQLPPFLRIEWRWRPSQRLCPGKSSVRLHCLQHQSVIFKKIFLIFSETSRRVAFPTHSRSVWDTTHSRKILCVVHLNFRKSLTEIPRNGCGTMRAAAVTWSWHVLARPRPVCKNI